MGSKGRPKPSLQSLSRLPINVATFFRELEGESDRACALIAGAAISDGLGDLLRLYCVMLEENDISHLFHDRGAPLGDFATRTDVSFALGLISPQERLIANVIRRIRNVFAHTLARIEFSQELIVSELSKIAPGKSWPNSTDKKRSVELSIMLYSDLRVRGRYLKQRARLADGNSKPIYELEKQTVASRV